MERPTVPRCALTPALASLSLLAAVLPAFATDGVVEINQVRALAGGVTAGDAPGLPVTLSASGSYVLTSDLALASENTTGIEVAADGVSIDLNGFTIAGPTACSGVPLACSPTGSGYGIDGFTRGAADVSVRNGAVRGAGSVGVYLGEHSVVRDMRVAENGSHGIYSYGSSVIRDNLVRRNGSAGVLVYGGNNLIQDNVVRGNTLNGIDLGGAADSAIVGNVAAANAASGIVLGSSGDTGWGRNVIGDNGVNAVFGTGVQTGTNVCDGAVCP